MNRFVILVFSLFSVLGFCQDDLLSFRFRDVRVSDLIQVAYTDVLQRSFLMDSSLTKNQDSVTLDLSRVTPAQFEKQLHLLLDSMGYQVRDVGGIAFFSKRSEGDADLQDIFVYRPVNRSVSYLIDLSSSVFRRESFSNQRIVSQEFNGLSGMHDTGSNASSMISKPDADVIVFRGAKSEIDKLRNLLVNLDTPSGEVLVKAVVYEVRNDTRETNAVSLAIGLLKSLNGVGISLEGSVDSGNAIKIRSSNIQAVWSALSADSRFNLLSSPTVRIKSGGKARFMAGQEVPTLGSISYPSSGQSVQSVDYRSSGVILEIQPDIRENAIELNVNQQISDFTSTSTGVNNSPTLLKRELNTSVVVDSGEVVILGGLEKTTNSNSSDGLSFLPDFFRSRNDINERTEIMMLLHVQKL